MNQYKAKHLARDLMLKHGIAHWDFGFDRSVMRFGICYIKKQRISLSALLVELNEEPEVRDVILHEIAHALAGLNEGHGPKWKQVCRDIGAIPKRCYSRITVTQPKAKLHAVCGVCRHEAFRNRMPNNNRKYACGKCYRKTGRYNAIAYKPNRG